MIEMLMPRLPETSSRHWVCVFIGWIHTLLDSHVALHLCCTVFFFVSRLWGGQCPWDTRPCGCC